MAHVGNDRAFEGSAWKAGNTDADEAPIGPNAALEKLTKMAIATSVNHRDCSASSIIVDIWCFNPSFHDVSGTIVSFRLLHAKHVSFLERIFSTAGVQLLRCLKGDGTTTLESCLHVDGIRRKDILAFGSHLLSLEARAFGR